MISSGGPGERQGLLLLISIALFLVTSCLISRCEAQHGARVGEIPAHLRLAKGARPALLARTVSLPILKMGESGEITHSDVWCNVCASEGRYAEGADLPPVPARFCDQRLDNVLNWFRERKESMPVVLATKHMQFMLRLGNSDSGLNGEQKRWMKTLFPKLGHRLTSHMRAHLTVLWMLESEERLAYSLGVSPNDPIILSTALPEGTQRLIQASPRSHYGSRGRMELIAIDDIKAYKGFGRHFLGAFGHETQHWLNVKTDSHLGLLEVTGLKNDALQGRATHMLAHAFSCTYRRYMHHLPAWLFAGHAHCFEQYAVPGSITFCTGKGANRLPSRKIPASRWRRTLRARSRSKSLTPIVKLISKMDVGDLTLDERIQSWSITEFLLTLDRLRYRQFMDTLKSRKDSETLLEVQYRAIEAAYDVDLITFEKAWKSWL